MSFLEVPLKTQIQSSAANDGLDTALVRSKFGTITELLGKLLVWFFLAQIDAL